MIDVHGDNDAHVRWSKRKGSRNGNDGTAFVCGIQRRRFKSCVFCLGFPYDWMVIIAGVCILSEAFLKREKKKYCNP